MAKVLVLYFSNYGSTKKYAEWIASELSADIYSIKNVQQNILKEYDTIILGSGLYAGNISGTDIIVNNYEKIKNKKLIIFTCGLADWNEIENVNTVNKRIEKLLPENIRKNIKIYFLRGSIDYKKLNLKHRIMMWVVKTVIKKKKNDKLNEEDKEFLKTYGQTADFTDKNSITEIVNYCRE